MYDAITNFIAYLEECIQKSSDPEETARLSHVLNKARTIRDKVNSALSVRAAQ